MLKYTISKYSNSSRYIISRINFLLLLFPSSAKVTKWHQSICDTVSWKDSQPKAEDKTVTGSQKNRWFWRLPTHSQIHFASPTQSHTTHPVAVNFFYPALQTQNKIDLRALWRKRWPQMLVIMCPLWCFLTDRRSSKIHRPNCLRKEYSSSSKPI